MALSLQGISELQQVEAEPDLRVARISDAISTTYKSLEGNIGN